MSKKRGVDEITKDPTVTAQDATTDKSQKKGIKVPLLKSFKKRT